MARFKTGERARTLAASGRKGGGKFAPTIKFEAGKTKYIQFLEAWNDIQTVLLHNFIVVGEREDGNPKYATFISRTDEDLDGADGYDPLIERFNRLGPGYGNMPTNKMITLAVELVPIYEQKTGAKRKTLVGFEVDTRQFENKEGETIEVPAVGLVNQAYSNFWSHVEVIDDTSPIEESVFAITRTGGDTSTSYTFVPAGEALDLTDDLEEFFESFDFEALLDEWADEQNIRELVGSLPDDFVVNPYGMKDAKAKKKSSAAKSTRSRRAEPEEETEVEEQEEAEEKPARSRRFAALRQEIEK
jgi:hypothetical protein